MTEIVLTAASPVGSDVSIGYVLGVVVAAICVAFALFAPHWRGLPGAASFRLGLVYNELPFVAFYLLLASTVSTLWQGHIRGPGGWATIAGAALVSVGIGLVVRRAVRDRAVVRRAVEDGLGAGWQASTDPALLAGLRQRPPYGRIFAFPFPLRTRNVARVRNVRYGDAGRRNLLDVFHRRDRPASAPLFVYFHGGGYFSGSKNREAKPLLHRLARHGWVCISATYRLRPTATFPEHLIDAKKVIAWARKNAATFGADPSTLFVAGSSAGGHLASLCALTANDSVLQPGFEDVDTSVTAAVSLYGYYGRYCGHDANEAIPSTPFDYPASAMTPLFMAHGNHDTVVPVGSARQFAAHLRRESASPVIYAELAGGHHAFDLFHSLRFEAVIDGVEAFAAWVRSQPAAAMRRTDWRHGDRAQGRRSAG